MKKITTITIAIFLIFIATGAVFYAYMNTSDKEAQIEVSENSTTETIDLNLEEVEIADTQAERNQGLQNRSELCQNCGMLFIFEEQQDLSFWMKNTQISLDMIFLDEDGRITTIHKNTVPFQLNPTYRSSAPSRYVLEANAGFAASNNLTIGDTLNLNNLTQNQIEFDESFL